MNKISVVVTALLVVLLSCKDEAQQDDGLKCTPGVITAIVTKDITLQQSFDLFNQLDMQSDQVWSGTYFTSALPQDSLSYVKKYLSTKTYINKPGTNWEADYAVLFHETEKKILVSITLWDMKTENQNDFKKVMTDLQLTPRGFDWILNFSVPIGDEEKWIDKFGALDGVVESDRFCQYRLESESN